MREPFKTHPTTELSHHVIILLLPSLHRIIQVSQLLLGLLSNTVLSGILGLEVLDSLLQLCLLLQDFLTHLSKHLQVGHLLLKQRL